MTFTKTLSAMDAAFFMLESAERMANIGPLAILKPPAEKGTPAEFADWLMKKMQEQLAGVEVEGQSGAGMVKVTMNCRNEVRRISIDPAVMDDREMLEDLVAAAVNDAFRRAEATSQERMGALTAGFGLPPGMKLPF